MSELLSISIPTRHRAQCLADLLADIEIGVSFGKIDIAYIAIYIFDNASTDHTKKVVDFYKKTLPIFYTLNEKNIGAERNIVQAYTAIKGEYVWVIGDDELLPKRALSVILNLIKKNSPALIIPRVLSHENLVELPLNYSSYSDFANQIQDINPHYMLAHGLISSNIIKRTYFDKKIANETIGTNHPHMYAIARGLKNNKGLIMLPKEETLYVRKKYLGPVDGYWPETIENDQVEYLEWLKTEYGLSIDPSRVVPDYLERIKQNVTLRAIKFIDKFFLGGVLKIIWFKYFVQK